MKPPLASTTSRDSVRADTTQPQRPRFEPRTFPAGSYIVRMDQPYSRIADALLDYQFWSPNDPQKTPYDDTGWTFPENFAVQSIRVTDAKVLDAAMESVTGEIRAPGGVSGSGSVFAINHNGDNALATLRYRFRNADFQIAEQPFEADGHKFSRGSFIIRGVSAGDLDKAASELGVRAYALSSAPSVAKHPARAARVAIMHTWTSTQTEGWWRQAFDFQHIPFDYISVQDVAKNSNLHAKYDVILFPPGGGSAQSIIAGLPMWRTPMPWKNTPLTPNIGTWAQTDDMRPGLGFNGVENLKNFVEAGGVLVTVSNTANFAISTGLANGVTMNTPPNLHIVGTLLRTKIVDDASPLMYGIKDSIAVYSDGGETFSISNILGGRGGPLPPEQRPTGRGTTDDPDVTQGRAVLDPRFQAPLRPTVQPWQAVPVTDEQLRNPLSVIPPALRPRVVLRFAGQSDLLVSGLLDGNDVAQRPVVIDAPLGKEHVVMFGNNPMYRGSTLGSYFMVFNTLLNWDSLGVGRKLDVR